MNKPMLDVRVGEGDKYHVVWSEERFYAECHGTYWRNLRGDRLVLALLQEIVSLREKVAALIREKGES